MSATTTVTIGEETVIRTPAEIRRARVLGILYLMTAAFVVWAFAIGSSGQGDATFGLARATDPSFPDLTVNASFVSFAVAVVLATTGYVGRNAHRRLPAPNSFRHVLHSPSPADVMPVS